MATDQSMVKANAAIADLWLLVQYGQVIHQQRKSFQGFLLYVKPKLSCWIPNHNHIKLLTVWVVGRKTTWESMVGVLIGKYLTENQETMSFLRFVLFLFSVCVWIYKWLNTSMIGGHKWSLRTAATPQANIKFLFVESASRFFSCCFPTELQLVIFMIILPSCKVLL